MTRERHACQQTKKVMHACTGSYAEVASGCLLSAHGVKPIFQGRDTVFIHRTDITSHAMGDIAT